jgi:drug/metabolite transporter (DMT)-like permease
VSPAPVDQRPLLALLIRLGSAFVLSLMLVFVKLLHESGVSLTETLFWRQLPTVPILLAWFGLRGQLSVLRSDRLWAHGRRAASGLLGMFLNFGAVTLLPLAEATTLNFTTAIWAVILAGLVLRQHVGPWRWGAVLLGFAGVLVITRPGHSSIPPFGAAVALAAAFNIALISHQIRDLAQTDHPLTIVFWFAAVSVVLLAPAMPFVMTRHTGYQWGLLAGLALFGLAGQFLLTAALRYGAVASVIVMDYSSLIWATLFGWLVFGRLPPASTWAGVPLIVGAGLVITWREHRLSIERARALVGE